MSKPNMAEKEYLGLRETVRVFTLSARRFYALMQSGEHPEFVVPYNSRKLVITAEFSRYLAKHPELRRRTRNGRKEET